MANKYVLISTMLISCVIFGAMGDSGVSKIQVGNEFFDQLVNQATKKIIEEANKYRQSVPEFNFDMTFIWFIPFSLNMKELSYEELQFVEDQFTIGHNGQIVNIKLNNLNLKGKAKVDHKLWFLPRREQTIDVDLNISASINLKIGITKEKFITVSLDSLDIQHKFNKLNIQGDWFLHIIGNHIDWFSWPINSNLKKAVQQAVNEGLNKIGSQLQKSIDIPSLDLSIGIKMENEIAFKDDSFEVALNINLENTPEENLKFLPDFSKYGVNKQELRTSLSSADQIQIALEQNLINSIIGIALKNRREFVLTNDSIPKDFPLKINTLYFQGLIPELYSKYPNKDLVITIELESFPSISFDNTQLISADINFSISFALAEDSENIIFSMSINNTLGLSIDSSKEDASLHLKIDTVQINDAFVIVSTIGDISSDDIKKNFNTFTKSLIYFINNFLRINPIPIPIIKGLKFESINVSVVDDNFLQIRIQPQFTQSNFAYLTIEN